LKFLLTLPLLVNGNIGLTYNISDFKVTVTKKSVSSKSEDRERKEVNLNIGDEAAGCVYVIHQKRITFTEDISSEVRIPEIRIIRLLYETFSSQGI